MGKQAERNDGHKYTTRIDTNHLLSRKQIEIVKLCTKPGDEINFYKDEEKIEGVIDKVYNHVFIMTDGRCFTWVDYITGSSDIPYYLRMFRPIVNLKMDPLTNFYNVKMMRVE